MEEGKGREGEEGKERGEGKGRMVIKAYILYLQAQGCEMASNENMFVFS